MTGKTVPPLLCLALLWVWAPVSATAQTRPDPPPRDRQPVAPTRPRVAPLPEAEWTNEHRSLVEQYTGDGRADNQLRTLLNVPAIVEGLMPVTVYLNEGSTVPAPQRALLILRAAWLCGNPPLWATHAARARDLGMTDEELRRVAEGPQAPGWDEEERTLLRLADELYVNSSVTNATWRALTSRYDEHRVIDAVETVTHITVLSMLYNSLGVQPDADTPDRLPDDVPYRIEAPDREPPLTVARLDPLDGPGIAVTRTFARHPALAQVRSGRARYINRISPLTPHDRETLILRIGWNCHAVYEWAKHVGTVGRARDHGVDPVTVAAGPTSVDATAADVTLLRMVDELYQHAMVSKETWDTLLARYDLVETMSAVYTPRSYRATSMSLNTYGVQLEAGDEGFPELVQP